MRLKLRQLIGRRLRFRLASIMTGPTLRPVIVQVAALASIAFAFFERVLNSQYHVRGYSG